MMMMNSRVYTVIESDGYEYLSTISTFDSYEVAVMVMNAYAQSESGQWYSYFIREYEVHKSPGTLPKPWNYYDEEQEQ
jgi:hypothetical protein